MKLKSLLFLSVLSASAPLVAFALPVTGVTFKTSDAALQKIYNSAVSNAAVNVIQFTPTMKILVEGGGFRNCWLETQPMGGEMYAKRNVEVALNNQVIFIQTRRADGRVAASLVTEKVAVEKGRDKEHTPEGFVWLTNMNMLAVFQSFQGYNFPDSAWKMYFWAGKDRTYLQQLYDTLEGHDNYLWRTRDSNGDGILETWCIYDTGEDHNMRLMMRGVPTRWPFEKPPGSPGTGDPKNLAERKRYWSEHFKDNVPAPTTLAEVLAPIASMDIMAYSYGGRITLAKISRELGNGREKFWQQKAEEVRQHVIKGLWDEKRQACFDHDRNGKQMPEITHNNIRCMWHGMFTQEMADGFIREHMAQSGRTLVAAAAAVQRHS